MTCLHFACEENDMVSKFNGRKQSFEEFLLVYFAPFLFFFSLSYSSLGMNPLFKERRVQFRSFASTNKD